MQSTVQRIGHRSGEPMALVFDAMVGPDHPPVKEPPTTPGEIPVEEPERPPKGPFPPQRPPIEEPPDRPDESPVREPPPKDPNRRPPHQPPVRRVGKGANEAGGRSRVSCSRTVDWIR